MIAREVGAGFEMRAFEIRAVIEVRTEALRAAPLPAGPAGE
jgi:hypothetical protein